MISGPDEQNVQTLNFGIKNAVSVVKAPAAAAVDTHLGIIAGRVGRHDEPKPHAIIRKVNAPDVRHRRAGLFCRDGQEKIPREFRDGLLVRQEPAVPLPNGIWAALFSATGQPSRGKLGVLEVGSFGLLDPESVRRSSALVVHGASGGMEEGPSGPSLMPS